MLATMTDCLFCKIAAGELPATIVHEDERTLAFMDIHPLARGHCLVIPRAHSDDLLGADPEDVAACARAVQLLARRAEATLGADGVTVLQSSGAAAWQSVFHLHFHVLPRTDGDGITLPPGAPAPGDPDGIAEAAQALRG
jgi:histidine triad (HIT) family protein